MTRVRVRRLATPLVLFAACGSLLGCTADDLPPPVGTIDEPIVNGSTDNGHPAVVGMVTQGQIYCTGTLITPTVVLTAAHCLPPHVGSSYQQLSVFFGTSGASGGTLIDVVDGWTNPAWNEDEIYEDVGLVRLQSAASTTPIPLNTTDLFEGQSTTLVGFGVTSANGGNSGHQACRYCRHRPARLAAHRDERQPLRNLLRRFGRHDAYRHRWHRIRRGGALTCGLRRPIHRHACRRLPRRHRSFCRSPLRYLIVVPIISVPKIVRHPTPIVRVLVMAFAPMPAQTTHPTPIAILTAAPTACVQPIVLNQT